MAILYNPFYCYDLDPALPNKLGGCPLYLFQMGILRFDIGPLHTLFIHLNTTRPYCCFSETTSPLMPAYRCIAAGWDGLLNRMDGTDSFALSLSGNLTAC